MQYKHFDNHTNYQQDKLFSKRLLLHQIRVRIQYLYIWYTSIHHFHDIQNIQVLLQNKVYKQELHYYHFSNILLDSLENGIYHLIAILYQQHTLYNLKKYQQYIKDMNYHINNIRQPNHTIRLLDNYLNKQQQLILLNEEIQSLNMQYMSNHLMYIQYNVLLLLSKENIQTQLDLNQELILHHSSSNQQDMQQYNKHLFHHKFNLHLIRDILIQVHIKYTQQLKHQYIIYMMRGKHNKYLTSQTNHQLNKYHDKLQLHLLNLRYVRIQYHIQYK